MHKDGENEDDLECFVETLLGISSKTSKDAIIWCYYKERDSMYYIERLRIL